MKSENAAENERRSASVPLRQWLSRNRTDFVTAALLFGLCWAAYTLAPVTRVYDSRYALLLSEQIYRHGDFRLEAYFPDLAPRGEPDGPAVPEPSDYRLYWSEGHLYNYFPPGSSILSAPFIPVFRLFGRSPVSAGGRPFWEKEQALQRRLAALLTSLFALLVFALARCLLPLGWSVFTALATAWATPALSIASRGLWSHTWGIVLLALAIWVCWRAFEKGWTPLAAVGTATLLSWCFLVRPTFALSALGIALLAALLKARWWWLLPLTGLAWLLLFTALFWTQYGTLLPAYFQPGRLDGSSFAEALAGNLLSPSRGLLVFVPGVLFWAYCILAYWRRLPLRGWAALAAAVPAAHWILISTFPHWWGGHCYGPRLMMDVLPWLALLGILSTRAWLDGPRRRFRLELAALVLLWTVSAAIHITGALSFQTQLWNVRPNNIDQHPERLWEWRDPQFLAPLRNL